MENKSTQPFIVFTDDGDVINFTYVIALCMWEDDSEVGIDADMVSGSYTIFRCRKQDTDTKSLMSIFLRDLTLAWVELDITSFSVKSWYTSNIHKYTVHHYNPAYGILESED